LYPRLALTKSARSTDTTTTVAARSSPGTRAGSPVMGRPNSARSTAVGVRSREGGAVDLVGGFVIVDS
jgi:hypothetical protein